MGRLDAVGGWIASPIEYARFVAMLFGQRGPGLLQPATLALLGQRPPPPVTPGPFGISYGLGWEVRSQAAGPHLSHQGSLPGTKSIVTVRPDGTIFVAVFNSRPALNQDFQIGVDMDQTLNEATNTALLSRSWPEYDLFELYR